MQFQKLIKLITFLVISCMSITMAHAQTKFTVLEVNFTVKDYAEWKKGFDQDSVFRKSAGLGFVAVGQSVDNPNHVSLALSVADMGKAKAFMADPRLKDVMAKNGVISKPESNFWNILRVNMSSKEPQYVLVTHKVKDFDAWVKVFDKEGTEARLASGLVDVALARGVEDPNLVHLVFDIKDMMKVKAHLADPALKQIMMDGGVEGMPVMEFYNAGK